VFYSNLITVEEVCNCGQSGEGKDISLSLKSVFYYYTLLDSQPLDQSNVILRVLVHDVLSVSLSHTRFRPKGVMVIARRGF